MGMRYAHSSLSCLTWVWTLTQGDSPSLGWTLSLTYCLPALACELKKIPQCLQEEYASNRWHPGEKKKIPDSCPHLTSPLSQRNEVQKGQHLFPQRWGHCTPQLGMRISSHSRKPCCVSFEALLTSQGSLKWRKARMGKVRRKWSKWSKGCNVLGESKW